MKPITLGMIGSGDVSNRYFEQAAKAEQVRFAATSARRMENAERKAKQYGVPRWYDDYNAMLETERLDAVFVTTPHSVHAEAVMAALEKGLPVLNEKPMATTFEDCRRMVELAERKGLILMNLPFDLQPALTTALRYLNEDTIGKLTGAEVQLNIPGPPRDNWYYNRAISHGGAILDCMVYPLSRLMTLLGPARSIVAEVNTLIPQRIVGGGKRVQSDVDDNATAIVEFAGGQHAVVRTLWGTSFRQNSTLIYGRKGTIALNDSGFPLVIHSPEKPIEGAKPVVWRGLEHCYAPDLPAPVESERDILSHFVHCLRTGEQPRQSARQQLHVHEAMFGAYRSAETGSRYVLTTDFEPFHPVRRSGLFDTRSEFI
ncbi:Gfo/Idh/MocA family protein [Paenibacillus hodogayensis]|uniref:Gfo/Idh/MocA family protein n=1 Tax=Paenibacillus hodogayensis TaxID=279208 RepID=A0ABV5W374_9BACL